jgi:hypothetical protein
MVSGDVMCLGGRDGEVSAGKERPDFCGVSAILIMAPKRIEMKDLGLPSPSRVSSLIEVSPSEFNVTADE